MNESELKKIIAELLEMDVAQLEQTAQTEWDSLAHLSILMAIEARMPGKMANLEGVDKCLSYDKLAAKLKQIGLLK